MPAGFENVIPYKSRKHDMPITLTGSQPWKSTTGVKNGLSVLSSSSKDFPVSFPPDSMALNYLEVHPGHADHLFTRK